MYYLLIIFLKNKIFPNKIYKFHLQRLKQTPFKWKKKRKPEIWDRRKSEDSRFVENACPAFLLAPTSLFFYLKFLVFCFLAPEGGDTFLLDCIKITFNYSYLMENFSLVSSHNLLENPLLFPTEITNLLFVIKTRQPLK